jgi:hypothetical protein
MSVYVFLPSILSKIIKHSYLSLQKFEPALETTIVRLGFRTYLDLESLYPHLVTPILYIGPLYGKYFCGYLPFQKYCFKML